MNVKFLGMLMYFKWFAISNSQDASYKEAKNLCENYSSIETQIDNWLDVGRSIRVCSGETTGVKKPSVCLVYEEGGKELGEGEMLLTDVNRLFPHVSPVSEDEDSSEGDGVFWDDELCIHRAYLDDAINLALSYATSYIGEAKFEICSDNELACPLEEIDPQYHPKGRIVLGTYMYQDPTTGKGFGEHLYVFIDQDESERMDMGSKERHSDNRICQV